MVHADTGYIGVPICQNCKAEIFVFQDMYYQTPKHYKSNNNCAVLWRMGGGTGEIKITAC